MLRPFPNLFLVIVLTGCSLGSASVELPYGEWDTWLAFALGAVVGGLVAVVGLAIAVMVTDEDSDPPDPWWIDT